MSSFFIRIIARMTRSVFAGSLSTSMRLSTDGTICQDSPYLSFSQPQSPTAPPAESLAARSSTSSCVSQLTDSEIASVNLNSGPPFSAMNSGPVKGREPFPTATV